MPNCRKAAEHLAEAYMICDRLKSLSVVKEHPALKISQLELEVSNLKEYLESFFKEIGRRPFEGALHDLSNLENQARQATEQRAINQEFLHRYAEDMQKQIMNQGFLDLIDCQCKLK